MAYPSRGRGGAWGRGPPDIGIGSDRNPPVDRGPINENRGPPNGNRGPLPGERGPPPGERGPPIQRGQRGVRRPRYIPTPEEKNDVVPSRPQNYNGTTGKKGSSGRGLNLITNYFTLIKKPNWCIYNYHVDFKPEEDRTPVKKSLLRQHKGVISDYIFDGCTLYTASRLHPEPLLLYSVRPSDQFRVELSVKLVQEMDPGDVMTIQFFNITMRKSLSAMGLQEVNRHFYDESAAFPIEGLRLTVWPGFKTAMRNYENNVLLCVEPTHKVFRMDNALDFMNSCGYHRNPTDPAVRERIKAGLCCPTTVMTSYNRKTYQIKDINWDMPAGGGFETEMDGIKRKISYIDYYNQRYPGVAQIRDRNQPLLVAKRSKKDFHRGMVGDILLVPELCQMTGLSNEMRTNPMQMRQLADKMNMDPEERARKIRQFMGKLKATPEARNDLTRWGLDFSQDLVSLSGRVIPQETILFDDGGKFERKDEPRGLKGDWTAAFRTKKMLQAPRLSNWVLIVPPRDRPSVDNLIGTMQRVSRTLNFPIDRPLEIMTLQDIRPHHYDQTIRNAMATYGARGLQMIFVILPRDNDGNYMAVKKLCTLQYGIPSQCFLSKNVNSKGLMSIATKCVVQMCAKLGGEPWTVHNPIKDATMILGFDVHHSASSRGKSVGALVCTTNQSFTRYFSTVSYHENREEVSPSVCQDIAKCLVAYEKVNKCLPNRMIMYRDGVGEGQLSYVYNTELEQIKSAIKGIYDGAQRQLPKLTFIVVTKRINTRIFSQEPRRLGNPEPGTCVDDVITKPESFDFYLISQTCKPGTTVSPTSYNVLFDQQGVAPDTLQKLTYRLCHLYFNWSGCVAVPSPVQYAHRLAFQTGTSLDRPPSERLSHLLHFL